MTTNNKQPKPVGARIEQQQAEPGQTNVSAAAAGIQHRALQLQTVADISRATSSILNLDELLSTAVEVIKERFLLCHAAIFLLDDKKLYAQLKAGTGEQGKKLLESNYKFDIEDSSLISRCLSDCQAHIAFYEGKNGVQSGNHLLAQTRSEILLPLAHQGDTIGVMTIQSDRPAEFSFEDIPVFQTMADQLSNAIENARLFKQLNHERDLLHALMDNIPDAIYFKDDKSRFLRVTKAMAEKMGFSNPDDLIGKTDFDVFTKEHAQQAYDDEQRILTTALPEIGIEEKETWPDAHITWVSSTKMPLRNKKGDIIGTFGVSRDITKNKVMEKALRSKLQFEEHITSLSTKFINLDVQQIDDAIFDALKVIGVFTGSERATVLMLSENRTQLKRKFEWCAQGIQPQALRFPVIQLPNHPWLSDLVTNADTVIVTQIEELPEAAQAEKQLFRAQGIQSLIYVPLAFGGASAGIIGIESVTGEITWPDDTTMLLTIVGEVFLNAFARQRADEELQKAKILLEMRVEERTSDLKNSNDLLETHIAQLNFLNSAFYELSSIIIWDTLLPAILKVFLERFPQAYGSLSWCVNETARCVVATGLLNGPEGKSGSEKALAPFLRNSLVRPFFVEDWTLDERLNRNFPEAIRPLPFYVAIPLIVDNKCAAVVQIFTLKEYSHLYAREQTLLVTLAAHAAICLSNAVHYQELKEKSRLDGELDAARSIQRRFTPHYKPDIPRINLKGVYYPAFEVGGDYLDYFQNEAGNWIIVIADVCGKGIPAALLMTTLRSTFRVEAKHETSSRRLLCSVNEFMALNLDGKSFVTALCIIINKDCTEMSYSRAGHPMLLKLGANGGAPENILCSGLALGLVQETETFAAMLEEKTIPLISGDRFLIYTDGLIDATDPQKNTYGFQRLRALLSQDQGSDADGLIALLMKDIKKFTREAPYHDDLTILALQVT